MDNDVTVIRRESGRTRVSLDLFGLNSRFLYNASSQASHCLNLILIRSVRNHKIICNR